MIVVNVNDTPIFVWCTIYNCVSCMQQIWVFWLFFITLNFLICFVILVCELIFCGNFTSWVSQDKMAVSMKQFHIDPQVHGSQPDHRLMTWLWAPTGEAHMHADDLHPGLWCRGIPAPSNRQPWAYLGPWIHESCLTCCFCVMLGPTFSPASTSKGEFFKVIGKIRGEMNL